MVFSTILLTGDKLRTPFPQFTFTLFFWTAAAWCCGAVAGWINVATIGISGFISQNLLFSWALLYKHSVAHILSALDLVLLLAGSSLDTALKKKKKSRLTLWFHDLPNCHSKCLLWPSLQPLKEVVYLCYALAYCLLTSYKLFVSLHSHQGWRLLTLVVCTIANLLLLTVL